MSNITVFDFEDHPVRSTTIDDNPWFVANDVCRILGIENPRNIMARLDDDEKGVHTMDTLGGNQQTNVISESGLYALVLSSRKPKAKEFRKWITSEVIPSIRKTGHYSLDDQSGGLDDLDWDEIGSCVSLIRETRHAFGRKAAQNLWRRLPIPQISNADILGSDGDLGAQSSDPRLRTFYNWLDMIINRGWITSIEDGWPDRITCKAFYGNYVEWVQSKGSIHYFDHPRFGVALNRQTRLPGITRSRHRTRDKKRKLINYYLIPQF